LGSLCNILDYTLSKIEQEEVFVNCAVKCLTLTNQI
jgi:hypothetical protein